MIGQLVLFWPAMTAAFLASLVEAVEALTIARAVGLEKLRFGPFARAENPGFSMS